MTQSAPKSEPTVWLLVPSFLLGPETWSGTARVLSSRGEMVVVADPAAPKADQGSCVSSWVEDVIEAIPLGGEGSIVVVGHAAACPRIPLVARRLTDRGCRVEGLVLVNGRFPADGLSPVEVDNTLAAQLDGLVRPDDYMPPWPRWWGSLVLDMLPDEEARTRVLMEARCVPRALFDEPIPAPPLPDEISCGYIATGEMYQLSHLQALREGWYVSEIEGEHLHLVVGPTEVADELQSMLARFRG